VPLQRPSSTVVLNAASGRVFPPPPSLCRPQREGYSPDAADEVAYIADVPPTRIPRASIPQASFPPAPPRRAPPSPAGGGLPGGGGSRCRGGGGVGGAPLRRSRSPLHPLSSRQCALGSSPAPRSGAARRRRRRDARARPLWLEGGRRIARLPGRLARGDAGRSRLAGAISAKPAGLERWLRRG